MIADLSRLMLREDERISKSHLNENFHDNATYEANKVNLLTSLTETLRTSQIICLRNGSKMSQYDNISQSFLYWFDMFVLRALSSNKTHLSISIYLYV